ncbi:hypothetical protein [Novosphingobium sp. JCM 18896]|uniref:hypothetical protein n=1 Tax=Novosphingobium sp. JCM 18896 TaxID=2989731 RepID=UPI002223DD74|nr:hypothetical protein [Novosphingobium sp. JCM 18896]MCW1429298.1 hypothetical protein [Novosphingobium sp. JCM 18896]
MKTPPSPSTPPRSRLRRLILPGVVACVAIVAAFAFNAARGPAGAWTYSTEKGADGNEDHFATLLSSNRISQKPPYDAETTMEIVVGQTAKGPEATLRVSSGQLMCPSYAGCTGTVRFDDGPERELRLEGFLQSGTRTVFVKEPKPFIAALMRAQRVTIRKAMLGAGTPRFEFAVAGLDWDY